MQLREVLKTLDLDLDISDDAIVTDVLVMAKVQRVDGRTTAIHCVTEGTDWITCIGLAKIAYDTAVRTEDYDS